jgi:pyruvate dehydrogenase E1 component
MYLFRSAGELGAESGIDVSGRPRAQLLGSGAILNEVLAAQELLLHDYGVAPDVWSVTSYSELRREAMDVERWNWLHPSEAPRVPYVAQMLSEDPTLVVGATDYLKSLPDSIAKWVNAPLVALGTDGFGRSATRAELRDFFEVDARHIAFATLSALVRDEALSASVAHQAMEDLKINPERPNPATL